MTPNPWLILGAVVLLGITHSAAFYQGSEWQKNKTAAKTLVAKDKKTEKKDEIRNRPLDTDAFVKCLRAGNFGRCTAGR